MWEWAQLSAKACTKPAGGEARCSLQAAEEEEGLGSCLGVLLGSTCPVPARLLWHLGRGERAQGQALQTLAPQVNATSGQPRTEPSSW